MLFIRLILGGVFIWSSYHKIEDPAAFAKILYGYGLFPDSAINLLAISVPFVELTTGFCLIFGLFPRSALMIINLMMIVFILVIAFNLLRGHQFDCGCFSSLPSQNQTLLNIFSLVRDIVMLGAGVYCFNQTTAS